MGKVCGTLLSHIVFPLWGILSFRWPVLTPLFLSPTYTPAHDMHLTQSSKTMPRFVSAQKIHFLKFSVLTLVVSLNIFRAWSPHTPFWSVNFFCKRLISLLTSGMLLGRPGAWASLSILWFHRLYFFNTVLQMAAHIGLSRLSGPQGLPLVPSLMSSTVEYCVHPADGWQSEIRNKIETHGGPSSIQSHKWLLSLNLHTCALDQIKNQFISGTASVLHAQGSHLPGGCHLGQHRSQKVSIITKIPLDSDVHFTSVTLK
jgi:hypothetical protein